MSEADPAEHDSLLGARIDGRYSVLQELGRGGMGVVYEGVHDELGRSVAIKVLNLAWATDPTAVARFLREARVASSFSHPNIVDVQDLGRLPDGRPFLVMPKIVGTDLSALLAESGVQPAKRVAELLSGVAAALDLIHARGFVHRDIKPENLMYVVRDDGAETVMLLDFGIAAAVMSNEPRLTGQGAIFGTPQFMPPEVCSGGMPDARGDVYALATVAFELITGDLPFGGDNMMLLLTNKLTREAPSLSEKAGSAFPRELEAVVARGLAREPEHRFPRASEFISSLKAATEHAPVSWKSGVLRPSTESAAYPVGQRARTGRSRSQPIASQPALAEEWARRNASVRVQQQQPPPGTAAYRAHSVRTPPPPSQAADGGYDPRPQRIAPRLTEDDDYGRGQLGGSRGSDRQRKPVTAPGRESSGGRVVLLLGCLSLLLGALWLRERGPGAILRRETSGAPSATAATAPSAAAAAAPSAATQAAHGASVRSEAPPPSAAAIEPPPSEPSLTQPALPDTLTAMPTPGSTQPQAPAAAPPPIAANPTTVRPAIPVGPAPSPALKPGAALPAARPAPPKGAPSVEPPAPEPDPTSESQSSAAPTLDENADPVLKVEQDPSTVEADLDEPELPVRPPEAEAAQLTREATSALLAGEVSRAVELLEAATRLDPTHSMAWRTLGLAQERSGNVREALNAYQQYIQLAPHGPQSDMVRERMRALEQ